jgi:hypothetical protein
MMHLSRRLSFDAKAKERNMSAMTPNSSLQVQLIGFLDGVWNPEDLVDLPESPWVIVSAMRSRLRAGGLLVARVNGNGPATELPWTEQAERGRLGRDVFDPHGIAARSLGDGLYEILVIDHGGGEAVARLLLDVKDDTPMLTMGERIVQPVGTSGNAVAWMPDGGFVLTSMFDPQDRDILSKFARAEITGGVWRWTPAHGWTRFGSLDLSGANGIATTPDGRSVFVSEWSARRVWRLGRDGTPERSAETRFLPDNLRWRSNGKLLLAGQAARPEAVFGCEARGECCPLAFEIAELDPTSMTMEPLVEVNEALAAAIGFGGATGALDVGGELWVGSFTGGRIAKFGSRDAEMRFQPFR